MSKLWIQLDKPRADVAATRMIVQDVDDIATTTGADRDQLHWALRCAIERCAELALHFREPRAEGRRWIVVLVMPSLPM